MSRRFRLCITICLPVLVIAGALLLLWWGGSPKYAVYQDRALSDWLVDHFSRSYGPPFFRLQGPDKAEEAVRHLGTNAIPTLLRMLRAKDPPPLAVKAWKLASERSWIGTRYRYRYARWQHDGADYGFKILGTNAASAVSDLTEICGDSHCPASQYYAARALGYVGRPAQQAVPSTTMFLFMRLSAVLGLSYFPATLLASGTPLDTYGELTGKTILAPYRLPSLPDSIVSELPPDKTNAIAWLESEFSKRGISVIQDGPSFVRLSGDKDWRTALTNAPLRGAQLRVSASQQVIPAGAVNFPATAVDQVLSIYAELKNRTILRSRFFSMGTVRFKNQCALTREELIYAIETVLALDGIATVDDGKAFVQIVPMPLRSKVNTHAPTRDAAAKLFDPKKVPAIGYSDQPHPQTKLERDLERWRKAFFEFMRLNSTRNSSAQRLLELYAGLTDKKAEPSTEYENMPIWFHVTTPLSKSELLYAIETTFALNNLAITPVEEDRVRLGPNLEPGKGP